MDSETLLDELMKKEYERAAKDEYDDDSPYYLPRIKEEVKSEDFICKTDLSERIKEEVKSEDFICKTDLLEDIKEEDELNTKSIDELSFMSFKLEEEEEEFGNYVCNDSTFNENEFCDNSGNLKMSLFELLKEENEDEEDDEMYNYCNNTMPYEDGNMELENDKSSLLETLIPREKNLKMSSDGGKRKRQEGDEESEGTNSSNDDMNQEKMDEIQLKKKVQNKIRSQRYRDKKKSNAIVDSKISKHQTISLEEEEKIKRRKLQDKQKSQRYRDKKKESALINLQMNRSSKTVIKRVSNDLNFHNSQIAGPSTRNVPYVPPIDIADLSTQNEPDIPELLLARIS